MDILKSIIQQVENLKSQQNFDQAIKIEYYVEVLFEPPFEFRVVSHALDSAEKCPARGLVL